MTLLAVRDLEVSFDRPVVHGVSFDVAEGEVVGLVGESGSGKSVMCRAVLGLVPRPGRVTAGSIELDGEELVRAPERRLRALRGGGIGMVFQDPASSLNPVLSLGDQLVEPLRTHLRLDRRAARARARELLERVSLPNADRRLAAYPHELSGGMRQRVMIAIAISCRPRLLLADEPTTALDVTVQDQILALLLELQREEGMAMVLVSHDLGVIAETCDRVNVMYAGHLMEQAPAAELFPDPRHPYTTALLAASPESATPGEPLMAIPGQPPALDDLPPGCPFTPRCALARPGCDAVAMTLVPAGGPAHRTACPFEAGG